MNFVPPNQLPVGQRYLRSRFVACDSFSVLGVRWVEALAVGSVGAAALRKASWRLVPLIGLGYGAAYMDRVNISFAAVRMNQDLHFSAAMYGLGAGLFFVSYGLCEVPSNPAAGAVWGEALAGEGSC